MFDLIIGIDPGNSGFFSFYNTRNKTWDFKEMPKEKIDNKKIFSINGLIELSKEILKNVEPSKVCVIMEDVHGRGGWSATNNFNFGENYGALKMFANIVSKNIEYIRPQKWQSFIRKGYKPIRVLSGSGKTMVVDSKATAEMIVKKEFPNIDFRRTTRSKNLDHNKIDSFLIALYKIRRLNG